MRHELMKKVVRVATVISMAVVLALNSPAFAWESKRIGVIAVTAASLNNSTTAAPFNLPKGKKILVWCDDHVYFVFDTAATVVATATNGIPLPAKAWLDTRVGADTLYLGVVAQDGTSVNCYVHVVTL